MRIYIASPYTIGDACHNVRAQVYAAEYLRSIGHTPFVPLLTHLWHMISPHEYEYWMELSADWLTVCDAMVRLEGESVGADREVELAKKMGRTIYWSLHDIPSAR